jgi:hypothetical protein
MAEYIKFGVTRSQIETLLALATADSEAWHVATRALRDASDLQAWLRCAHLILRPQSGGGQ